MSTVNGSPTTVHGRFGVLSYVVAVAKEFTPRERVHATLMFVTIVGLHLIGFAVFILFVVPSHYKGLGIGVAGLAYTLGLRHAFDADHISAIDNTTRKLMNEGKRPLSIGFWFSLGHSTIVVAIGVGDRRRRDGRSTARSPTATRRSSSSAGSSARSCRRRSCT